MTVSAWHLAVPRYTAGAGVAFVIESKKSPQDFRLLPELTGAGQRRNR